MSDESYLRDILKSQKLADDSKEMKELREQRDAVEAILREAFPGATIRYGGSKAKGTLIRDSYDLDLACYLPNDTEGTLEDIYKDASKVLSKHYRVEEKTSAIRLLSNDPDTAGTYTHVDVVPGRYTYDTKSDCYLYQNGADKGRLKTNLDVHIEHIRDSGVTDALQLLKLWRVQNSVPVKQFAFELLCVELLADKKKTSLPDQIEHVLQSIRDAEEPIKVEDPANPTGNDLMPLLTGAWAHLQSVAGQTLDNIESSGWEAVYGDADSGDDADVLQKLSIAVHTAQHDQPTKPWSK
ncbi:MAG: nucleotidyltransferase domain-containing protein [Alphaproteobacteria bacterium]